MFGDHLNPSWVSSIILGSRKRGGRTPLQVVKDCALPKIRQIPGGSKAPCWCILKTGLQISIQKQVLGERVTTLCVWLKVGGFLRRRNPKVWGESSNHVGGGGGGWWVLTGKGNNKHEDWDWNELEVPAGQKNGDIAGKQLMKFKIDIRILDGLPHFITPRVHVSYWIFWNLLNRSKVLINILHLLPGTCWLLPTHPAHATPKGNNVTYSSCSLRLTYHSGWKTTTILLSVG